MKYFTKLFAGLFSIGLLTGCNFIGENYDYTPPIVSLFFSEMELEEANIIWDTKGDTSKDGNLKTEDIFALAKEQEQVTVKASSNESIIFDSQDFLLEDITVAVWKDGKNTQLEVDKKLQEFNYPTEKGSYVIEVYINTDSGTAQYVGNVLVD
jgi:hypothetical protein